jgi:hypothetical protein
VVASGTFPAIAVNVETSDEMVAYYSSEWKLKRRKFGDRAWVTTVLGGMPEGWLLMEIAFTICHSVVVAYTQSDISYVKVSRDMGDSFSNPIRVGAGVVGALVLDTKSTRLWVLSYLDGTWVVYRALDYDAGTWEGPYTVYVTDSPYATMEMSAQEGNLLVFKCSTSDGSLVELHSEDHGYLWG